MTLGCNQSTGVSVAAATTMQQFAALRNEAETLLDLALAVAVDVGSIRADNVGINSTYETSAQWPSWVPPIRPDLGTFTPDWPDPPPVNKLDPIRPIDIDAELPPLNTELMETATAALLGILQNLTDGLPAGYADALWNRAKDRVTHHIKSIRLDVSTEYRRRGWTIPDETASARNIAYVHLDYSLTAMIARDARIKVYETAVEVFKAALAAISSYFKTYAEIFKDYIDAQADLARNQINENELIIDRLQALVQLFEARSSAERARLEAVAQSKGVELSLYGATVGEAGAIAARDAGAAGVESERRTGAAADALENVEAANAEKQQNVADAFQNFQVALDNFGRILAAHAQAKGVSASMSSGVTISRGKGCTTSYSFTESLSS